ncbi:MAG: hypothetical protein P1V97_25535 [Planctomycetota bacterium]|nr:hypothetical protein [Planctomycetota bacterium]
MKRLLPKLKVLLSGKSLIAILAVLTMVFLLCFHCDMLVWFVEFGPKAGRGKAFKLLTELESGESLAGLLYLSSNDELEEANEARKGAFAIARDHLDPARSVEVYLQSLNGLPERAIRSRFDSLAYLLVTYRRNNRLSSNLGPIVRKTLPIWKAVLKKLISGKGTPSRIARYYFNTLLLAVACSDLKERAVNVDFIARGPNSVEFYYFNFEGYSASERRQLSVELELGSQELIELVRQLKDDPVLFPAIGAMALSLMGRQGLALAQNHYETASFDLKERSLRTLSYRSRLHRWVPSRCLARKRCQICSLYEYWLSVEAEGELLWTLSYLAQDHNLARKLSRRAFKSLRQTDEPISQAALVYALDLLNSPGDAWHDFLKNLCHQQQSKILAAVLKLIRPSQLDSFRVAVVKFNVKFDPKDIEPLLRHKEPLLRVYAASLGLSRLRRISNGTRSAVFIGHNLVVGLKALSEDKARNEAEIIEFLDQLHRSRTKNRNQGLMAKTILKTISNAEVNWFALNFMKSKVCGHVFIALLGPELAEELIRQGHNQPEFIQWAHAADTWLKYN